MASLDLGRETKPCCMFRRVNATVMPIVEKKDQTDFLILPMKLVLALVIADTFSFTRCKDAILYSKHRIRLSKHAYRNQHDDNPIGILGLSAELLTLVTLLERYIAQSQHHA